MKLLLISDTHGALDPRIAGLARGVDLVVHAGDVGRMAVLDALRDAAPRVVPVRGNNDSPGKCSGPDGALCSLPVQAGLDLPGGRLHVEHGDAYPARNRHARLRAAHPDVRAVLYGHSHRSMIDREAEPWILNPGAAGRQRTNGGPSCLLLEATEKEWRVELVRFERQAVR